MRWGKSTVLISLMSGVLINGAAFASDTIDTPFAVTGSAERGEEVFADRERGHCVLCHKIEGLDVEFQGKIGPDLSDVAQRLTAPQLRYRIADYDALKPGTLMPSYFRTEGFTQVGKGFEGKTILTGQEIEDIIVWLQTVNKGRQ